MSQYLEEDKNVECISGENYLQGLENYDIIMKTPGIAFVGMDISSFKDKIKSQLELLLEYFDNTASIIFAGTGYYSGEPVVQPITDKFNASDAGDYIKLIPSVAKKLINTLSSSGISSNSYIILV